MSYSTHSTKTYSYSSQSGQPPQSTVTETRTFIDADGTRRTETVRYGGEGSDALRRGVDDIGQRLKGGMSISSRTSKPLESRYSTGWSSRSTRDTAGSRGVDYETASSSARRSGNLYEDPEFPAVDGSLFFSKRPPRPFVWKRPPELCDNPQLFVGGASRFDVNQGMLGDCWLLAAVASISGHDSLFQRVVPPDQGFGSNYSGCFRFNFWQYGAWKEVVIDDRLPTYNGKLVFMHSTENNEFWSALLEKAYAKLMGSYEALKGGQTCEAMEDFTGGVTEMIDLTKAPENLFKIMLQAHARSSLMGCSIEAQPNEIEAKLDNGLIKGHAYSVTDVRLVNIKTSRTQGKIPLVRVRNPWGNEREWEGAWSDKSPEWRFITEDERRIIGLSFDHDGEFWMSFQDFSKNFQKLEICHLGVSGMDRDEKGHWSSQMEEGSWRRGITAGGCRNFITTFARNPQYFVTVTDADEDDDESMGTLIIGLMQKERRKLKEKGIDMLTMGYAIYKKPESFNGTLDTEFFQYNSSTARSPTFINSREVCGRHRLPPGEYAIIPSTFNPNEEGKFLLRIFSEKPSPTEEADEKTGAIEVRQPGNRPGRPSDTCRPQPQALPAKPPVVKENDARRPEETDADRAMTQKMKETFDRLAGVDQEIDAYELESILNAACKSDKVTFSVDSCRSLVAMKDNDKSGKLGFKEFVEVWNMVRKWKSVFAKYDADKSGSFDCYELRQALHSGGFTVSNGTFGALTSRYSNKAGKIEFDDFFMCVVKMTTMFETFAEMKNPSGKAEFNLDEFIQTTMYS